MAKTWGYARVSTDDQELRSQIVALKRYGVDGIFEEKQSGKDNKRAVLNWMLHEIYLRPGDTIVVQKLDRLGRSLTGLIEIVETIKDRGAQLVSLTDNLDTSTATGKFFFHIVAAMAQWERDMISERTKTGIAAAKANGVRFGRKQLIKDDEVRMAVMRDQADDIPNMSDLELWNALNAANPKSLIDSLETVRRWRRAGYPGLVEVEKEADT